MTLAFIAGVIVTVGLAWLVYELLTTETPKKYKSVD